MHIYIYITQGASPLKFLWGDFLKSWTSFVDFFGSQIRFNV